MFLKLTNRLGHRLEDGEKVAINFDKVLSIRGGRGGANLKIQDDSFCEFLCYETVDEILAMLAGGHNAPR